MSDLYDNFEKRFTNAWFSAGWAEIESKPAKKESMHKDLAILQAELETINKELENIEQKQLRLANLAKLYN